MGSSATLIFPPFELDPVNEQLWRETQVLELRPKTFSVLRHLADRPGRLVTKDELLDAVWGQTAVSDTVLKSCILELRKALGDDAQAPKYIATVHRRGYRFIAVTTGAGSALQSEAHGAPIRPTASVPVRIAGRATELTELHRHLATAMTGERQIVFVTGEPGIGKTALVEAFLDQIDDRDLWIGRGQCIEQYGAGEAYLPILDALGRLCRQRGGEHIVGLLARHAPTWLVQMPALLAAADLETLQRTVAGATRDRMLREMAEALEVLSAEQPLILWLEDLHWSDVSTLELLAMLGRRREPARLLLFGTYRPVDVIVRGHPLRGVKHELELYGKCVDLALQLLTDEAVAEFLVLRFGTAASTASFRQLAQEIHRRTEGNPLFVVNVVHDIVRRGGLEQVEEQWVMTPRADAAAARLPESLRQMVERQLDDLGDAERGVLEVASVAGAEFSATAVAVGLEAPVEEVEERCATLARREQFLQPCRSEEWPDGTVAAAYGFRHALYGEVTYASVPAGRRAQLHRRIGERIELAYGARAAEVAAQLAVHFERGNDAARAVHHLRQAAANALRRNAHREAI